MQPRRACDVGRHSGSDPGRRLQAPKERARFFGMARASANEVSMIFDVGNAYGVFDDETCARGKDICDHLGAMLYKFH